MTTASKRLSSTSQDFGQALSPAVAQSPLDFERSIELSSESHHQIINCSPYDETDNVLDTVHGASKDTMDPKPVDNETDALALKVVKMLKGKLGCVSCGYCPLLYIKKQFEYCVRVEASPGKQFDVYFKYIFGQFNKVKAKWINCESPERMSFDRFNKSK